MILKKEAKQIIIFLMVLFLLIHTVSALTKDEVEEAFGSIQDIDLIIDDDYGQINLLFNCNISQAPPPQPSCFALTPGFWKNRVCSGNPQSFTNEVVNQYLSRIRANSQYFSSLTSRQDACNILSTNNDGLERAKKFFLANLFNFASGGLNLTTPVIFPYTNATTIGGVFQYMDYVLTKKIKNDYGRIGDLGDQIASGDATRCGHEWPGNDNKGSMTGYSVLGVESITGYCVSSTQCDKGFLKKIDNCDGTYNYTFNVTNGCDKGLSYVAIKLPTGIIPLWPANGAIYMGLFRNYSVENPTNNPFYSIKYNAVGEGIKNGTWDLFAFKTNANISNFTIQIKAGTTVSNLTIKNITYIKNCNISVCGNGKIEFGEECDDGNKVNDDGCSSDCEIENICNPNIELVKNGGFEKPIVTNAAKWDIFPNGTSNLDWNVAWQSNQTKYSGRTRPTKANLELQVGVSGWVAKEGKQYAELDSDWDGPNGSLNGEPASVSIYEDIATVPGTAYIIKFAFSPRPGTNASNNKLEFKWDGNVKATISSAGSNNTNWTGYSFTFNASTASTRIQFTDIGIPDSLGPFLDNVSVKCIQSTICGNSIVEQGEECDDGNSNNNDFCKNNCKRNICGDGILYVGVEECDDGNNQGDDGCSANCRLEYDNTCADFSKIKNVLNEINKISFTKLLITFSIESIDPNLPIVSVYNDHYVLNDLKIQLGPFDIFYTNVCPDLAQYRAVLNNNSIKHSYNITCNNTGVGCFALTPGFWKNRVCSGNPQSFTNEVVNQYLSKIRAASQYFSSLTSRQDACNILSTNNPGLERAKKFFLANLFNFASGGLNLTTPVSSPYTAAKTIGGVFQDMDYVLTKKIKNDYGRIGDLGDQIASGDATRCGHEWPGYNKMQNKNSITGYVVGEVSNVEGSSTSKNTSNISAECVPSDCGNGSLIKVDNCDGTYNYTFNITNKCINGLSYAAINLPSGIVPSWPSNGAIYKGFFKNYTVENPTNNPFYSIKYNTIGEGIKNKGWDIFTFRTNANITNLTVQIKTGTSVSTFTIKNFTYKTNCSKPVCGNGKLEPGEECDDGNLVNGDGCSSSCKIEALNCNCTCETKITTYGPIRCIIDRIIFHIHKWFNQEPGSLPHKVIHSIIKGIIMFFFNTNYIEDTFYMTDLDGNVISVHARIEVEQRFIDYILDSEPYAIPPPGEYHGNITIDDPITKEFDIIINPIKHPWNVYDCFEGMPFCGNGALDQGEECDDGNINNGDGCNNICKIEH